MMPNTTLIEDPNHLASRTLEHAVLSICLCKRHEAGNTPQALMMHLIACPKGDLTGFLDQGLLDPTPAHELVAELIGREARLVPPNSMHIMMLASMITARQLNECKIERISDHECMVSELLAHSNADILAMLKYRRPWTALYARLLLDNPQWHPRFHGEILDTAHAICAMEEVK